MDMNNPADFAAWNEGMAQQFDPDLCHASPNIVIRWIEKHRVAGLVKVLDVRDGHSVLEVGCGTGAVLCKMPGQLTGIDLSPSFVERAKKRVKGTIVLGSAEELTKHFTEKFDRVYCTEVLEHVQTPDNVLRGIAACLKPDGVAALTVPNDLLINRIKAAMRFLHIWLLPKDVHPVHNPWHLHIFRKKTLDELCRKYFGEVSIRMTPTLLPVHYIVTLKKPLVQ
jgi:2-polyprenyl-3-methyl-5-hydroxy-6-metoxy-1,4-benzoquinol methylase